MFKESVHEKITNPSCGFEQNKNQFQSTVSASIQTSRTYLVFQGRPRSKQSILTNAQVNLRRLSDDIRYWPAIFDYHPANLSR